MFGFNSYNLEELSDEIVRQQINPETPPAFISSLNTILNTTYEPSATSFTYCMSYLVNDGVTTVQLVMSAKETYDIYKIIIFYYEPLSI